MQTNSILTYGSVTLSINEVGLIIFAIQYALERGPTMNESDLKSMDHAFKELFRKMSGKEYGMR